MGNFYSAPQNDVEHKYDFFIKIVLEHNSMNMGVRYTWDRGLNFSFLGGVLSSIRAQKNPGNHRFHWSKGLNLNPIIAPFIQIFFTIK